MGNHVVRSNNGSTKSNSSKKTVYSSRKPSGNSSATDMEHNFVTHFVPVDKLTKILNDLTYENENINGISVDIFTRYLFPNYKEFGNRFYYFLLTSSGTSSSYLNSPTFKQQVEKFLSQMNDRTLLDIYVQVYSNTTDDSSDVTVNALKDLFMMSYRLSMDDCLPTCNYIEETIDAAVTSCVEVPSPTEENTNIPLSFKMAGTPCPSHWSLLYSSDLHGAAVNRLLHHVLGYRGPTILFIRGSSSNNKCVTYCIGSTVEWHESSSYWGGDDSIVIQLKPIYRLIEKGPKLLYLNTLIRGYAQGLRAGSDTRNPIINVDQSFNSVMIEGAPYRIMTIEVWGCGDRKLKEKQLDIKRWQVKEAEKQRVVKLSSADWMDHPDRYLLELAGRPTYSNAENK
ncbi:MTOR-associated protein MEAK7 isoform X2 [Aphidius gifuensis]|uniref:MTOR-associated protein MEAK7 isoform X2 n=1 Tax=Aphidius gifuensis TaxID=684658 RepID=UPI001CDB9293|nr:MTOR-associated protein MEAK7 isoform X2 [Aphidius gifuensis]